MIIFTSVQRVKLLDKSDLSDELESLILEQLAGSRDNGFDVGQGFLGLGLGCLGFWLIVKAFGWIDKKLDFICGLIFGATLFVLGAYTLAGAAGV